MKKITVFNKILSVGGIEKYISLLANALSEDFEVDLVISYKNKDTPHFQLNDKVNVRYLCNSDPYAISLKTLLKEKKVDKFIFYFFKRKFIFIKEHFKTIVELMNLDSDYVITTRTSSNVVVNKYLKNKEVIKVSTEHNYHQDDEVYINKLLKSISNFDYFIVPTKELFEFYSTRINSGVEIIYIPNAIEIKSDLKSEFKNKNLISIGRFSEEKGFLDLVQIIYEYKNKYGYIHLTLIGDGYQREMIENEIEHLNLKDNIKLTGYLDQNEISEHLVNSSLYVMTSYTEAFGLVLLEAMTHGVPCIAFDSASGARELINDKTGVLIKNRDHNIMIDKIYDLISSKEKLELMQKNIEKEIPKYSISNHKKAWLKVLNKE